MLTALLAGGSLIGFGWAARSLTRGGDAYRLAAYGVLIGLPGFSAIIFSAPMESGALFRVGTFCIGLGAGLFAVGTLTAAMALARAGRNAALSGLALGAWGAVQATAMGGGIALGGALRDLVGVWGASGALGPGMSAAYAGYSFVYHLELLLLFATLIALGPLCGSKHTKTNENREFGLAEFPG
ncbi:MAG: PucC family protein, partial [Pseudomonadota bacterium]